MFLETSLHLHKKIPHGSASILEKIKKSLWFETVLAALIFFVFAYIAVTHQQPSFKIYFGSFALFALVFSIILYLLIRKINTLSKATPNVKQYLVQVIAILKQYIQIYFKLTMLLLPLSILFSIVAFAFNNHSNSMLLPFEEIATNHIAAIFIFCFILFSTAMYFFTKWYLHKLYGHHLEGLEKDLATLLKEESI